MCQCVGVMCVLMGLLVCWREWGLFAGRTVCDREWVGWCLLTGTRGVDCLLLSLCARRVLCVCVAC